LLDAYCPHLGAHLGKGGAFEVWRHKRFASRPALAAGDGPIGLYRQWTRQFYAASPTA
jgi:hypothetical protein